jgi:uncharacterized protein
MTEISRHQPGTFCWPELATTDQAAAKKFYTGLFGWTFTDQPVGPGSVYTIFQLDKKDVAAAHQMGSDMQGIPPHWLSYVSVATADDALEKGKSLGGKVMMGPFDVMEAGRMGVLQDPTGGTFAVWQGKEVIGVRVLDQPGSLMWTELMSKDVEVTRQFYTKLFNWETELHEMGPMKYFVLKRGDTPAGGMMQITPDMGAMPTSWMPYFGVDDVGGSAAKVAELGGRLMIPPSDIPNVGRFSVFQDPQGATLGIIRFLPRG